MSLDPELSRQCFETPPRCLRSCMVSFEMSSTVGDRVYRFAGENGSLLGIVGIAGQFCIWGADSRSSVPLHTEIV